jgi:hypothetical protein
MPCGDSIAVASHICSRVRWQATIGAGMPLACQIKRQARSPSAMTAGTAVFRVP